MLSNEETLQLQNFRFNKKKELLEAIKVKDEVKIATIEADISKNLLDLQKEGNLNTDISSSEVNSIFQPESIKEKSSSTSKQKIKKAKQSKNNRILVNNDKSGANANVNRLRGDKLMFGNLLETQKTKDKRLKLKVPKKVPLPENRAMNGELSWVIKVSGKELKKFSVYKNALGTPEIYHLRSKNNDLQGGKGTENIKKEENINEEDFFKLKERFDTRLLTPQLLKSENSSENVLLASSDGLKISEKCFGVPDVVINNITSFPILSSVKNDTQSPKEDSSTSENKKEFMHFPSVTNILRETMSIESKMVLELWKENMIKKLGPEQFEIYYKELLEDGKSLHSCIDHTLLHKEFETPPRIAKAFDSLRNILPHIHDVITIETYVSHPKLQYKGIVDCVASYRDKRYVIDWKKSDKKKFNIHTTYDAPIQLAAYIGAINAADTYPYKIDRGLVVVAYTNGEPATVHEIKGDDLEKYWIAWLKRLQKFYVQPKETQEPE